MIKSFRFKAGVVAAAAMAGLLVSAPSASAAGNCNHYGQAGYAQLFTTTNYTGDCWETPVTTQQWLPDYVKNQVSSLRFWSRTEPVLERKLVLVDYESGAAFTAQPSEWWSSLPSWMNDKADWIEFPGR
ncbi:hypothetical protein [Streptomyces sp. NPDC051219]|uniref:hypothetical protein n=1 Tax=Streptomyces sp. NPDC051219 TaxID=3155283 RepID=UPI00342EFE1C